MRNTSLALYFSEGSKSFLHVHKLLASSIEFGWKIYVRYIANVSNFIFESITEISLIFDHFILTPKYNFFYNLFLCGNVS
jgi:hypothetical protein